MCQIGKFTGQRARAWAGLDGVLVISSVIDTSDIQTVLSDQP
jgi:hypothetical protein